MSLSELKEEATTENHSVSAPVSKSDTKGYEYIEQLFAPDNEDDEDDDSDKAVNGSDLSATARAVASIVSNNDSILLSGRRGSLPLVEMNSSLESGELTPSACSSPIWAETLKHKLMRPNQPVDPRGSKRKREEDEKENESRKKMRWVFLNIFGNLCRTCDSNTNSVH